MTPIFLIVGGPAVGKSTTSRALAACFPKSIHIPVDDLRMMVVSGLAQPGAAWTLELVEQLLAARQSVTHMALTYRQAGFVVVIDDFWDPDSQLSEYAPLFSHPDVHKVLLFPDQQAAHQRNLDRAGPGATQHYLDQGIQPDLPEPEPHPARTGSPGLAGAGYDRQECGCSVGEYPGT